MLLSHSQRSSLSNGLAIKQILSTKFLGKPYEKTLAQSLFWSTDSFVTNPNYITYIISIISISQESLSERHKIHISHFGF